MEEREVIERSGNGSLTIEELEKTLYRVKKLGATHYRTEFSEQNGYSYVQFIEYYRVKTAKECLQDEKARLEIKLKKLNEDIGKCK